MSLSEVTKLHLVESTEDAMDLLRWLSTKDRIGFDTEGTGLKPETDRVRLVQIGDRTEGWAIPYEINQMLVRDIVKRFTGQYVMFNAPYDVAMMRSSGIQLPIERVEDTRLKAHVLSSTGPLALKPLAAKHVDPAAAGLQDDLKTVFSKNGWNWATVPWNLAQYWQYGALDPVITLQLDDMLDPQVRKVSPKSYDLEMAVAWSCEQMMRNGAAVDRAYVSAFLDDLEGRAAQLLAECGTAYGINPGSSVQVADALMADGVELHHRTRSGLFRMDKDVLGALQHPLAALVLEYRATTKLAGTYLASYLPLSERDGRIHPSINTVGGIAKNPFEPGGEAGVRTGRMSASDPNVQNVPMRTERGKRIRRSFTARCSERCGCGGPHTWIKCDFDQIEQRVMAHMSGDQGMREAFMSPDDFFVALGRRLFNDPTMQKSDPRRTPVKNCVPLDTQILTKRGWLKHDEVRAGDETLGYDASIRSTRWTTVTAVHHYEDAETVIFGNRHRKFEVTRGHRWVSEHERTGAPGFVRTEDQPGTVNKVLLAAPCAEGTDVITDREAAVIGWVLGDGHIKRGVFVGAPSQAGGSKVKCSVYLYQSKPHRVTEIDEMLADIPHLRNEYANDRVVWTINSDWARSILGRLNIHDKDNYDGWNVALRLGPTQRAAMLRSLDAADGGSLTHVSITEAKGTPVVDLLIALGYLTGRFSRVWERGPESSAWSKNTSVVVAHQHPGMTGQKTGITPHETKSVWCVTTKLGSWTMKQGVTPVLTGNSAYASIYGAGPDKFALMTGMVDGFGDPDIAQAQAFLKSMDDMYPGPGRFTKAVIKQGNKRFREEGAAYVRSPLTGRRVVAEPGRFYALVNYIIQMMAGEILKMKIVEADAAGLGQYMVMPVHDEIDLDVPTADLPGVVDTLHEVFNDSDLLTVPVTASVETGPNWGEVKEWTG